MPSPIAKNKHELTRAIFPYDEKNIKKEIRTCSAIGILWRKRPKTIAKKIFDVVC